MLSFLILRTKGRLKEERENGITGAHSLLAQGSRNCHLRQESFLSVTTVRGAKRHEDGQQGRRGSSRPGRSPACELDREIGEERTLLAEQSSSSCSHSRQEWRRTERKFQPEPHGPLLLLPSPSRLRGSGPKDGHQLMQPKIKKSGFDFVGLFL